MDDNNAPVTPSEPVITPTPQQSPNPYPTPVTPQPTASSPDPGPLPTEIKPTRSKKPLFIGLIVLAILGGVLGYVFGYYLPNQPQSVWNTALNRTGETLEKLVIEGTKQEKLESFERSKVTGSFDFKAGDSSYMGDINSSFDSARSNSALNLQIETGEPSVGDNGKLDMKAELMSNLAEGKNFPDTYFRLTGFKEFGLLDLFIPGISSFDGQWVVVGSDYLQSQFDRYAGELEQAEKTDWQDLTASEIAELGKAVTNTLNEHVFTSDESKGIVRQHEFVAKEDLEAIKTYHYKAGLVADNLQPLCTAMIDNVFAVGATAKIFGNDSEAMNKAKTQALDGCNEPMSDEARKEINELSFDLWVDAKYKLIHMLRFTSENDQESHVDVGQRYTGGDEVILFVKGENQDTKGKMETSLNLNTQKTNTTVSVSNSNEDNPVDFSMNIVIEPQTEEIEFTLPENPVDIRTLLNSNLEPQPPLEEL